MKRKLIIIAFIFCTVFTLNAQWSGTNPVWTNSNVGIGTSDPVAKIHIFNTTLLGSTTGNNQIISVYQTNVSNYLYKKQWVYRESNGTDWTTATWFDGIDIDGVFPTPGINTKTWWKRDPYPGTQSWGNASTTQMTLTTAGLGIGTTSPAEKLSVSLSNSNTEYVGLQLQTTNNDTGAGLGISFAFNNVTGTTPNGASISALAVAAGKDLVFRTSSFNVAATERMRINNAGNVLIGKNTQSNTLYKLDVAGNIRADEVVVNTSGADYVFAPDYNLLSLPEVEKFINENKHLPDLAPATEMKINGMNVSEMQTKLLQKVEELTLYVIEQNKRIELLEQHIKSLNK